MSSPRLQRPLVAKESRIMRVHGDGLAYPAVKVGFEHYAERHVPALRAVAFEWVRRYALHFQLRGYRLPAIDFLEVYRAWGSIYPLEPERAAEEEIKVWKEEAL